MTTLPSTESIAADWLRDGRRVVSATLVERIGSAPLDPGAQMLVDDRTNIEGSVTGGCVEGALVEEAQRILDGGEPRLVTYGVSDEEAADVGLMCGGTVRVFVHEQDDDAVGPLGAVAGARASEEPVALATMIEGGSAGAKMAVLADGVVGSLRGTDLLDHSVARDARGQLDEGISRIRRYGAGGELMGSELVVYIQAFASWPRMVIFGAIDFSAEMAKVASEIGYRVTICDARAPFVSSPRFSRAAEVVVDWPDRYLDGQELGPRDVVLVFTHDAKFDEPALMGALATGAGYVGALGSRQTQARRVERLRAAGLDDEAIARIHAPCGLDIGARTPPETVVSILAEVIAVRTGRAGESLARSSGPIHPEGATKAMA
ncbi:MAG TPA: XdhC/CoxI family protein [Thermoleophilaceae bacterium]|nr:XdhC/CoxI family protein [Thermoleophilaceae bacterium]